MINKLIAQNIFQQRFDDVSGLRNAHKFISLLVPYLFIAYFVALGTTSNLDGTFSGVILILGLWLLFIKIYAVPPVIKITLIIGMLLFFMALAHATLDDNLEMLFKFQFANLRNMIFLPLIALVIMHAQLSMQSVWRIIVLAGSYTVFYSILVLIEQPKRSEGLLSEAIVLGNIAMMFALLSLVAFFGLQGRWWKLLAMIVVLFGMTLSMLSGTRAGLVAMLITGLVLLWSFYGVERRNFLITLGVFVFIAIFTALFWEHIPVQQRVIVAFNQLELYFEGNSNSSVGARLDMWKIGLLAFLEQPIFGWGTTPYKEVFIDYVNSGVVNFELNAEETGFAQPHNDYILVLFHFGLVGLLLVLSFIFYPAMVFIKAITQAKQQKDLQLLYFALTGLVAIEVLLDFMMFNLAFMNKIFYVYSVVILMVLFVLSPRLGMQKN